MAALRTNPRDGKTYLAASPTGGETYWPSSSPGTLSIAPVLDKVEQALREHMAGNLSGTGMILRGEQAMLDFMYAFAKAKRKR